MFTHFGVFKNNEEEKNMYISFNYCPKWKLKEGLRELLQNQRDEIVFTLGIDKVETVVKDPETFDEFLFINKETGESKGGIKYEEENEILIIENFGKLET